MSVISKKNFLCFIHIPRTGGHTVRRCMEEIIDDIEVKKPVHSTISKSFSDYPYLQSFLKFSYVRNPYDLLVSQYCYTSQSNNNTDYQYLKNMSFFDFINWIGDVGFKRQENDIEPFYRTQTQYLTYNNQIKVDKIFKNEMLCNDMGTSNLLGLFLNLDLKMPKHIPVLRKSERHFSYTQYYDSKTYKLVNKLFKEDFKNFKYKMNEF